MTATMAGMETTAGEVGAPEAFALPPTLWPALATLIGRAWPPGSEDDIAAFVRGAEHHRMLAIAAGDLTLPAPVRARAAERYAEIAEAQAVADRDSDELLALLPQLITRDWLCVNGADFRSRLYPSSRLRPMSDLDLLVRPADAPALAQQLLAHGFVTRPPVAGSHDIGLDPPPRADRPWHVWLDLYPGLVDRSRADIDYEEIWRARERGPHGLPRMARHHALAAHALLIANMQLVTHLRKLLDLWLLSRDPAAVRGAVDCARRWNIRRSLYVSFAAMRRLFPEASGEVGEPLSPRARAPLDRLVALGAPFERFPSRPVQIWRKLSLLDSPAIRVRFLASHAGQIARHLSARRS